MELGADLALVKGFALFPDEYTAGPELGAAADMDTLGAGAIEADMLGAGAGDGLKEVLNEGDGASEMTDPGTGAAWFAGVLITGEE